MLTLETLGDLLEKHREEATARVKEVTLGKRLFDFNLQPAIMGVINLSADSWYRESVSLSQEQAIRRAKLLQAQGADIIDLGAESTLGHAARVDQGAQKSKLVALVQALRAIDLIVSTETYQPSVAQACLEAGANLLNLTGTEDNEEIYRMVAVHDAAVIICYVQGRNVREVGDFNFSNDPIALLHEYFAR